ncbi:MAG TPA: UvrD-helicase domain-containing protein [Burkholderiales bacterium]|nr:UvrD-helicase domain-containing protein [Burkholderiales bacterium]
MSATPIADAAAREAALDPLRSFIVQAPAGSGKTDLLVRRFLKLLSVVEKPEEIVAITFTIKAAAEMRERILSEVNAQWAHRLRIQTIDAFCASLTRQMPVVSGFGAQPGIVEEADAHYREAALRTINELSPAACRLLLHLDNYIDTATSMIAAMLAKRDQWLRKTGVPPTRDELECNLRSERERILAHARSLHPKASIAFSESSLTKNYTWRKQGNPVPPAQQTEPLRQALEALLRMPEERYSDEQWEVLGAILELLPRAAAHLKVVFAERGETDFTEIAQGAVRALGTPDNPTDLLLALDTRVKHILVDEFQDTSYSQFELLERLTAGWQPGDGRTLFLVGDPMQSIYRFREAKVALYLQAWQQGLGTVKLERLTLTSNFRSQSGLVDWHNVSFPHILPREADPASGAVPYSPATPHSDPLPGNAAVWHQLSNRKEEAARIVDLIRRAEGTKAILVRNRLALAEIVPALKAAGIRYRAIEIEHLGEKQVVQDLYALTRALLHLGDRIAWLSVLRAPWCALTLERLLEVGSDRSTKTIWETIKDDLFLADFTRVLAPAVANRERGSLRDRVEGVWLALGGPACVADKTELEDAERYLDELEKLEEQGPITDLRRLHDALDRLYALPDVDATDTDLQIMTIHKSKGLEFGTVIVPGLDMGPGSGEPDLLLFNEVVGSRPPDKGGGSQREPGGLLLAPIKPTGAETDSTYRYLRDVNTYAEDVESSRLLYVAATRAEHRLHLMACLGCDKDGELKKPAARTLLSRAWSVAEAHFSAEAAAPHTDESARIEPVGTFQRFAPGWRISPSPQPVRWTPPSEGRDEQDIEFSWAGETARHVGTVVHHWLQCIADDAMRGWDASRVEALGPLFRRELERRGIQRSRSVEAARLVADALKNALDDDKGRWLLGPHPEARSEHRLRLRDERGLRSCVIDRLFRDVGGERWIVDFKTSRHEGGGLEAFLDEQKKRYQPQLNTYAAAFERPRLGLYFPILRGWREWE